MLNKSAGKCDSDTSRFADGLAHHLRVSKRNLYCWRMAGLVPYYKIGRAVRFRKSEVDAALERMRMV